MKYLRYSPPTYPMRPLNGGRPLPQVCDRYLRDRQWSFEPKVNGWRGLLHVPSGRLWNRHGQPSTIAERFTGAIATLQARSPFEWLDVEMMERRLPILQGALILLDGIAPPSYPYIDRRALLAEAFPACELPLWDFRHLPASGGVFRLPAWQFYPGDSETQGLAFASDWWYHLRQANTTLGCELYEGCVAKRLDSPYTQQLRAATVESPQWIKHRWAF